jgi:hypothetical protein
MRKVYMLSFNAKMASRDAVTDFLENDPTVYNWKAHLPFTVVYVSTSTEDEMAEKLSNKFGRAPGQIFMIAQISGATTQGVMSRKMWDMINQPDIPPSG